MVKNISISSFAGFKDEASQIKAKLKFEIRTLEVVAQSMMNKSTKSPALLTELQITMNTLADYYDRFYQLECQQYPERISFSGHELEEQFLNGLSSREDDNEKIAYTFEQIQLLRQQLIQVEQLANRANLMLQMTVCCRVLSALLNQVDSPIDAGLDGVNIQIGNKLHRSLNNRMIQNQDQDQDQNHTNQRLEALFKSLEPTAVKDND